MILHIQNNEFLSGVTIGNGIQVVVHEQGAMPFPSNDGIAVEAGSETNVALRMVGMACQNVIACPHEVQV